LLHPCKDENIERTNCNAVNWWGTTEYSHRRRPTKCDWFFKERSRPWLSL